VNARRRALRALSSRSACHTVDPYFGASGAFAERSAPSVFRFLRAMRRAAAAPTTADMKTPTLACENEDSEPTLVASDNSGESPGRLVRRRPRLATGLFVEIFAQC